LKAEKLIRNHRNVIQDNKILASQYEVARLNQFLLVVSEYIILGMMA